MSEAAVNKIVHADGADVQGDLDARGLSVDTLSMTGLKLRGDLALGCRKGLRRGYPNNAVVFKVDAKNASVDGSVVITHPGNMSGVTLDRLDRERAFERRLPELDFTNATIKGSFNVLPNHNASAKRFELALGCRSLLLRGVRIDGDLKLVASLVMHSLEASYAEVAGNVEMLGVWVQGDALLNDMRVAGWVVIGPYVSPLQTATTNLPLASRFDSGLSLALSRVARLGLNGIDCHGDLGLWNIRSESMVHLEAAGDLPCRVRAKYPLGQNHDGNLLAYGLSTLQLDLDGVDVEGDIVLKGVDLLELYCRPALLRPPGKADVDPEELPLLLPRCAYFRMANAQIRGNVELVCIQVIGAHSRGECGISIGDSEIKGELLLAQADRVARLFLASRQTQSPPSDAACACTKLVSAIAGPVMIKRCAVGAKLNLTGVQADEGIDLEDSRLSGDLIIAAMADVPPAHAPSLTLRKLHCANDVDLTGLVLEDAGTPVLEPLLKASHSEVTADLHLCRHDDKGWKYADIHGGIDFSFATLAHLVVHHAVVTQPDALLNLQHARIARIEIPRGEPEKISLPKTQLRGASIELWDPKYETDNPHTLYCELLGRVVDESPEATAALVRRLRLDGQTAVAESVYRFGYKRQFQAEVRLGDSSPLTIAARRTLSALSTRLAKPFEPVRVVWHLVKRAGRIALHRVYHLTLGFGTQIYRLIIALLVVAGLALPITRSSSNFEASLGALTVPHDRLTSAPVETRAPGIATPSASARGMPALPARRGAQNAIVKESRPAPTGWGKAEATQLLLKNWLPMLPLHARDDWQPRGDGPTAWSWRGHDVCAKGATPTFMEACLPLAPEDWLNILQLLCWMGWPLALTMFVRRVLRQ